MDKEFNPSSREDKRDYICRGRKDEEDGWGMCVECHHQSLLPKIALHWIGHDMDNESVGARLRRLVGGPQTRS